MSPACMTNPCPRVYSWAATKRRPIKLHCLQVARLVSFPEPSDDGFSIDPAVKRIAVRTSCSVTSGDACVRINFDRERRAAAQYEAIRKCAHQGAHRPKGRNAARANSTAV